MKKKKSKNRAHNGSGKGQINDHSDDKTSDKREQLISLLEVAGGIVFGGLAIAFSDAGFHKWSFLFGWLAMCCGLAIVTHYLEKMGVKYIKTTFVSLVILTAVLFTFFASQEPPQGPTLKARFRYAINAESAPGFDLMLTNSFLQLTNFVREIPGKTNIDQIPGIVVIPRNPNQTNLELFIGIQNDSFVTAEDVSVCVFLSKSFNCMPEPSWQRERLIGEFFRDIVPNVGGVLETNDLQGWILNMPFAILPGDAIVTPAIKIESDLGPRMLIICARAKDSVNIAVGFHILFLSNSAFPIHKPFAVSATNNLNGYLTTSFNLLEYQK